MKIIPVLLAAVIAFPVTVASAATSRPLNVIILVADDMGWGDRGCQGHPYIRTPSIDRLARSGCRLDQFYFSAPVCSPSRAGLCTGRIQNRFGLQPLIRETGPVPPAFHHVPLEEPFLPRLLKSAGFTTAHIGKWHPASTAAPANRPWPTTITTARWCSAPPATAAIMIRFGAGTRSASKPRVGGATSSIAMKPST